MPGVDCLAPCTRLNGKEDGRQDDDPRTSRGRPIARNSSRSGSGSESRTGAVLIFMMALKLASAAGAAEFTFDAAEFARKPFEYGGYLESRYDHIRLNRDGALYGLAFRGRDDRSKLDRGAGLLKLEAVYTRGAASLRTRTHLEYVKDEVASDRVARFDELALSWKPHAGFTLEAGKIVLRWGKGYAWNPVAFVERMKDPTDPELAREGFWMATADWVRTFAGPLRTVAFTPVIVPTGQDLNSGFGRPGHVNVAAKLYLLLHDTDIDFAFLSGGSRPQRYGVDFARNITSNLAMHGEWARIRGFERRAVTQGGAPRVIRGDADSYLLGLRYLSARDATYIVEYYRNGTGYSRGEMEDFFRLVENGQAELSATGSGALLARAATAAQAGYGRPQPMGRYAYFRVSQKEPFDILYFTPSFTSIVNLTDGSFTVVPELSYTGLTNLELRARFFWLHGGAHTDFGERQNRRRLELRARLHF
jgi:hypothetical protein